MSDSTQPESRERSPVAVFVFVLIGLPLLLFAPLILAFIEHAVAGTDHVEEFLREIGLHDPLGRIYRPVLEFIARIV